MPGRLTLAGALAVALSVLVSPVWAQAPAPSCEDRALVLERLTSHLRAIRDGYEARLAELDLMVTRLREELKQAQAPKPEKP